MSSSVYAAVLFVHVLAATVLFGNGLAFVFTRRAIRSAATVEELRGWLAYGRASAAANPAAAVSLLATGVLLGSQGWWTATWFHVAIALFLVDVLYAVRKIHAIEGAVGEAAASAPAGAVPESIDRLRWSSGLDLPYDVLLGSDLAALLIMIAKPGLAGCAAAVAAANLGVAVVRARRRRASIAFPDRALPTA